MTTKTTEDAAQTVRSFMAACKSAVKCGESWSAEMEKHHEEAKRAAEVLAVNAGKTEGIIRMLDVSAESLASASTPQRDYARDMAQDYARRAREMGSP